MKVTSVLRVNRNLHNELKKAAKREGRTLEWMAEKAIEDYLASSGSQTVESHTMATDPVITPRSPLPNEPTVEPNDDWGA